MYAKNAEIYNITVKTGASGVEVNSRSISPIHRSTAQVKSVVARKLDHWCRGCGTYMTNQDGLCAKCRQPLVEEYKAKLNSPVEIGLAASLHAQGYEPHFQAIECEAVMGTRCKLCAGACYYMGFKKGNSYKAISRCVRCGNEYEF